MSSARRVCTFIAAVALLLGCHAKQRAVQRMRPIVLPVIRAVDVVLEDPRELRPDVPLGFGVHTIYLDAGHGAAKNPGNTSSYCIEEQEFARQLALDVGVYLEDSLHFGCT